MGRYLCRALSAWPSTCTDGRPLEIYICTSLASVFITESVGHNIAAIDFVKVEDLTPRPRV